MRHVCSSMPSYCRLSRSSVLGKSSSITLIVLPDFLVPALHQSRSSSSLNNTRRHQGQLVLDFDRNSSAAPLCHNHRAQLFPRHTKRTSRQLSSTAGGHDATSWKHQRFDSEGRLIIETTAPRQPAYTYADPRNTNENLNRNQQRFAAGSRLPPSFFDDVNQIRDLAPSEKKLLDKKNHDPQHGETQSNVQDQMKLLKSVRDLEEKLGKARRDLATATNVSTTQISAPSHTSRKPAVLTKKDYLNLVDLYFYSRNSRFSPESSDQSPTPLILNDYSFTLSADFTKGDWPHHAEEEDYVSPLKEIEDQLKNSQLREIAVMQVFIDLLLDDRSSNRALFEAYKELPQPGVGYLPKGVIRLFLQRMSTPWVKTQASHMRYLSIIDDMQEAKLPITLAEWSSAIYLAAKTFGRVDNGEVARAFNIWRQMENEAAVKSGPVTFNILFDAAVRSGKFALGETILNEMHKRNLRLNRMGRVSLMYYHGLRGDGDGVRKAYHDFVEAGEIVDTLVLNCVIASLINAQEPAAAEQIYQRMKEMQATLRKGWTDDGNEILFKLHPEPGSNRIDDEMASNHLGRVLSRAPHLRDTLPEHHIHLQSHMPLTPNFTTYRIMLAYHSATSGDIDRMTVLLKEMLEIFDIPLFPVVFQILFKGFAIHNPTGGPDSKWSKQRLDMVWDACRNAIKDANRKSNDDELSPSRTLPSIRDVNEGMSSVNEAANHESKGRTLSMWQELVVDLAAFPRERLKRLQRYHSTQFDDSPTDEFHTPFFQQAHYAAPQPELDDEEGEYTLPDPIKSNLIDPTRERATEDIDEEGDRAAQEAHLDEEWDRPPTSPQEGFSHSSFSSFGSDRPSVDSGYRLRASKPMICWLLRAYARVTRSRAQVEEVWGSARKIWHPKDDVEAQIVVKVLLRCLRDCDRTSGLG